MPVPNKFVNSTPPVLSTDLDAEKFNQNFDALSAGIALNDKSITQRTIDETSLLVSYFIKQFVDVSALAQDPASLGLVNGDIIAVNGTGDNVGKLFKIVDVILPIFVPYTDEKISAWQTGIITTGETSIRVQSHQFIITGLVGKPINLYEGSVYYQVNSLDLDTYDQLKITVTASSKNFYIRLRNGNIPSGLLELINSPTPGTYTFNLKTLTGLSGIQSFLLEIGVSDPSLDSILDETVYISNLVFTSTINRWQLYKPQIINFEVLDKSNSNTKYRLIYNTLTGWEWEEIVTSGGESADVVYSNPNPTPITVGGIPIGATFLNQTIKQMFDALLYPYVAPAISLLAIPVPRPNYTTIPSDGVYEKGIIIPSVDLYALTTKKSNVITGVEFFKNSISIYSVPSPIPGGGMEHYTDSASMAGNTVFQAKVDDDALIVTSNSRSFTFVYPFYVGAVTNGTPNESEIKAMTKQVKAQSNTNFVYTITNQRFCIAYPDSYGALNQILDTNLFDIIGSFNVQSLGMTMLDSAVVTYKVYVLQTLTTQTNFTVQFKF